MASAASSASSTVVAGRPSGTGIPWRAKSCLPWDSSRSMSPSGVGNWKKGLGEGAAIRCYAGTMPLRLVAAGFRPGRPALALALLLILRGTGVLQLGADEV